MDLRDALTEAFELVLMDTTIESAKVCGKDLALALAEI